MDPINYDSSSQELNSASTRIVVGFSLAVALLFVVGIVTWFSLDKLNHSAEHYSVAGRMMISLDRARLNELTFTRDKSEESIEGTYKYIDEALSVLGEFDSLHDDVSNGPLLNQQIKSYRVDFKRYTELNKEIEESRAHMVTEARRASASAEALQNLQLKYINIDKAAIRKLRSEMKNISNNAVHSYEVSILVESIRNMVKDFFLFSENNALDRAIDEMAG